MAEGTSKEYRTPIAGAPGKQIALSAFDGAICHYTLHGSKRNPLVVCIHGIGQWSFTWDKFVPVAVADGYRVLTYDLFGRGYSSYPPGDQTGGYMVRQLHYLLKHLKLHKTPFALIGHSMGGGIAALFADRYPDLVEQLVLIGPAGLIEKPFLMRVVQTKGLGDVIFKVFGKTANRRGQRQDFYRPKEHVETVEWVEAENEKQLEANKDVSAAILNSIRHFPLTTMDDVIARLGEHSRRVLIIWGAEDQVCPYKLHTQWQELIPSSQLLTVPDAGHGTHLEAQSTVHRAILNLLVDRDVESDSEAGSAVSYSGDESEDRGSGSDSEEDSSG